MKLNTKAERLNYVRRDKGLTYTALADLLDGAISGDGIRAAMIRDRIKPYYLTIFADKLGINRHWLETGLSEMLSENETSGVVKEPTPIYSKPQEDINTALSACVADKKYLKQQIEAKDKQLEDKDKQIEVKDKQLEEAGRSIHMLLKTQQELLSLK